MHVGSSDHLCMNTTHNIQVTILVNFFDFEVKSENETYDLYYSYAHKIRFNIKKEHHSY